MPKQRPSFLKRQKEQARRSKAEQKREARMARRRRSSSEEQLQASDIVDPSREPVEPTEKNQAEA
jgi:hypothetical protein